jgi:hypothetical protein
MTALKTWTAKTENAVIIVTAETVELAIRNVVYELGITLVATDLIPLPTHHRHVRIVIPMGKTTA